jgi:hypothetical protein
MCKRLMDEIVMPGKEGRSIHHQNEWMVCVEGRCNPPNGVVEESLDLMQQDSRHVYCGSRK